MWRPGRRSGIMSAEVLGLVGLRPVRRTMTATRRDGRNVMDYHVSAWLVGALLALASGLAVALYVATRGGTATPMRSRRPR